MSAAAQNGHAQLSKIYEYFRSIEFAKAISIPGVEASARFVGSGPDSRVIDFLEAINTGVIGYQKRENELPEKGRVLLQEMDALIEKFLGHSVNIEHDEGDKHVAIELAHRGRQGEQIYLDLDSESAGTRRLLIVLGLAYQALDQVIANPTWVMLVSPHPTTPCSFVELTTLAGERRLQTWAEANQLPDLERNVEPKRR